MFFFLKDLVSLLALLFKYSPFVFLKFKKAGAISKTLNGVGLLFSINDAIPSEHIKTSLQDEIGKANIEGLS